MKPNTEPKRPQYLYEKDIDLLKDFMKRKNIGSIADAARICIEYSNAHGALS